ncbi:ATP-grasp domain-containing protein [Marvinbryantia formatexigens]|nr:ATP-grasp domain-containing protein [Marvinbryantia formatexigens]UWO26486.1 ATP-grasp domain-containing protein [Marvinbryantia formatexigens DSM 14469]SDF78880.1 Biotin carboxylase [Marvinbryantia formatexigens]
MKKVMILGASYSLVPLIHAAQRLGCHTIAASIPGDYPGFAAADESCFCDITKPEEVLQAAQSLQIDGIATCCMDVGLRSLGYTATKLGLPGPSWETVQLCTDKYKMKQAFVKAGVQTAAFFQIHNEDELASACGQLRFPVIIKAVDQMGSRGIFRCDTREEVFARYPQTMAATAKDYCILEEFLTGTMFGVEAMLEHGKLAYFLPLGNVLHQANPPFPIGHYVPWTEGAAFEDKIRTQIECAAEALGADNCPLDFDMMLKDGEVYVIEATARAGATCIAEQVGIHFGIDYYEAIVRLCTGEPVALLFGREKSARVPCEVRLLEAPADGVVQKIVPGTETGGNLAELSFNISVGDTVRRMENGRDRIGQVIVKGNSPQACRRLLDGVLERIQVQVGDA